MPRAVEEALIRAFKRKGAKKYGKSAKEMTYATLTNMQKKGEIEPWRKLKG